MTQERLDVADVSAVFQNMGGASVAEQVTGRIRVRVFEALQGERLKRRCAQLAYRSR
jgi:hypothetical protein